MNLNSLLQNVKTIAILGIKPELPQFIEKPSYFVPKYISTLKNIQLIPLPIGFPNINEIFGNKCIHKLSQVPESLRDGNIDILDLFVIPQMVEHFLPEILNIKPKMVWFQTGIRNDKAEKSLKDAGIDVVVDKCLMIEFKKYLNEN